MDYLQQTDFLGAPMIYSQPTIAGDL